ncbi:hypothetical protein [Halomonas denitrificans]|nr:hypothetical protein [Halomonas denitrificans]
MRIRRKARKWVVNLWTLALAVLGATGLNPFEAVEPVMERSMIVRDVQTWSDAPAGLDAQCVVPRPAPGTGSPMRAVDTG